jgi:hypothetical protein
MGVMDAEREEDMVLLKGNQRKSIPAANLLHKTRIFFPESAGE